MFIFLPQTTSCERNISGWWFNEPSNGGKSILNIHWKDWCWSWNSNTLATYCEEKTLEKTLMLGKIEGRRRREWQRMRWLDGIHWLDGQESEQAPGVGEGQGSLVCCSPWGCKESDTTEPLNWTECFMCMDSTQWMFYSWEWKLW